MKTPRRAGWIGIAAVCIVAAAGFAEEAEDPEPAEPASEKPLEAAKETPAEPEAKPNEDDAAAEVAAAEVFVPSEDISEDFAVPFPVDI